MRLSVAIRLGAMLRPQAIRHYLDHGKTCAVGAALEAIGIKLQDAGRYPKHKAIKEQRAVDAFMLRPERAEWGKLATHENRICPECGEIGEGSFISTVIHLNNDHEWTRERIAAWVETLEQQQEALSHEHMEPNESTTPDFSRR